MPQLVETPGRATFLERVDARRRNVRRTINRLIDRADLEPGSTDTVPEIAMDHLRNTQRINRASRYTQPPP